MMVSESRLSKGTNKIFWKSDLRFFTKIRLKFHQAYLYKLKVTFVDYSISHDKNEINLIFHRAERMKLK